MKETKMLTRESLTGLFSRIKENGMRIVAPVKKGNGVFFEEVDSPDRVCFDYIHSVMSAKHVAFPPYEELLRFQLEGRGVEIVPEKNPAIPTVLFGVHPCDARSFAVVRAVYTWDYDDVFVRSKLDNLTVVGLSCASSDEYCFCASVDGGPGDVKGSDILLTATGEGGFLAEIVTDKGGALAGLAKDLFLDAAGAEKEKFLAKMEPRFDLARLTDKLPGIFQSPIWLEQSYRCLGCGACAFVCPTCTCFDIQDEKEGRIGVRQRCWDSCKFHHFTLHTSGHNPRPVNHQRWRQRIMHKFSYEPERLDVYGCVGCGRCSRACPADMNLLEHLRDIVENA